MSESQLDGTVYVTKTRGCYRYVSQSQLLPSATTGRQCRDGRERDAPGDALRMVARPSKCSRWLSTPTGSRTAAAPHGWASGESGGATRGSMCGLICCM